MARFTANGGLKLHLHGERSLFGGEPKGPIRFRVCGERYLKNPVRVRNKDKSGWRQELARVSTSGKKTRNSKSGEKQKREGFDDTDVEEEEEDEDDEEEDEFGVDELACFRGLVLDISYRPVNVVCWKRAICLEFMEKADVLEYYDQTVSSALGSFYIPAVLRVPHLLQAVKRRRIKHSLSRKSIFYRDSYTCQYCSSNQDCTIDHVLPISRGGEWKWENLVTACTRCNSRKGHKSLEEANMKLIKIPKAPKDYDIISIPLTSAAVRMLKLRKGVPDEWRQHQYCSHIPHREGTIGPQAGVAELRMMHHDVKQKQTALRTKKIFKIKSSPLVLYITSHRLGPNWQVQSVFRNNAL